MTTTPTSQILSQAAAGAEDFDGLHHSNEEADVGQHCSGELDIHSFSFCYSLKMVFSSRSSNLTEIKHRSQNAQPSPCVGRQACRQACGLE